MSAKVSEFVRGGFLGVAVALAILTWTEGKNLPWLILITYATVVLVVNFIGKPVWRYAQILCLVLVLAASFMPCNIDLRSDSEFAVGWLPVEYDLGHRQHLRDLEATGLEENKDYVVVRGTMPYFPALKRSLVLVVPGK